MGAVPFLWGLWSMWTGTVSFLRTQGDGKIFDLQARAIMHGHLWVKNGVIGLEAFRHDGHEFTYFGVFPSLIRIPFLALTSSLDGRLTAASMFFAWVAIAVFSALLLWRVRHMLRGRAPLGRAETVSYGILMATITGGSILVFLGATPWVYHEDLIWSVALSTGFAFALLGVLETPTRRRVLLAAALLLAANLNRLPTGYACLVGAGLAVLWFATGRGGEKNKRWAWALAGAAGVALFANWGVNFAKFGTPMGLPMQAQVWTSENLHRRQFLAANGGNYYGVKFLPSTLKAYFQPFGLRFTSVFPFITLPAAPAQAVGVLLDAQYRTASLPASMPLMLLLTVWGVVATFARRSSRQVRELRIPVVALGLAPGVALLWGYIDPRFLGDFMPVLIIGSVIGLVDLWRRWDNRSPRHRSLALGGIALLAAFSIAANFGMANTPTLQWNQAQLLNYVKMQRAISNLTGHPIAGNVVQGARLPYWAPADEIFVVGNCRGLYISDGQDYSTVRKQQLQHWTWRPVGYGPGVRHRAMITFHRSLATAAHPVPILTFGPDTVTANVTKSGRLRLSLHDPGHVSAGTPEPFEYGVAYRIFFTTDPMTNTIVVSLPKHQALNAVLTSVGHAEVPTSAAGPGTDPVSVTGFETVNPKMTLCHQLLGQAQAGR